MNRRGFFASFLAAIIGFKFTSKPLMIAVDTSINISAADLTLFKQEIDLLLVGPDYVKIIHEAMKEIA